MFVNYANLLQENTNWFNNTDKSSRVIGWVSGGIASMTACALGLEQYDNLHLAFCNTNVEHPDTFRFIADFEKALGVKVHQYKSKVFDNPEQVWYRYLGLNFAHGAPCSTALKKDVRKKQIEDLENDYAQLFGFDFRPREIKRAVNMVKNSPELNPKFPLIENELDRSGILKKLKYYGIEPPVTYNHFDNNNCIASDSDDFGGCVQGGVGYWQKMKEVYPRKFKRMADNERVLTYLKGEPVTICKDQRKQSKGKKLFLEPNPHWPDFESIDVIKGRQPEGLIECMGHCSTEEQLNLF